MLDEAVTVLQHVPVNCSGAAVGVAAACGPGAGNGTAAGVCAAAPAPATGTTAGTTASTVSLKSGGTYDVFTSYSVESANGLSCNPQQKLVRDNCCCPVSGSYASCQGVMVDK
jgi:hypothetical protein